MRKFWKGIVTSIILVEMKKQTILEWCRENHVYIDAPCDGKGTCGRCRVKFWSDAPEASEKEYRCLTKEELEEGIRLACVAEMTDRTVFEPIEADWRLGFNKNEVHGQKGVQGKKSAQVQKKIQRQETAQVQKKIQEQFFGIAIDIGTTTLAMRLVGLTSGKEMLTLTEVNHQRAYGADVISRIQSANEGNLEELQSCIQEDIYQMLTELTKNTEITLSQIRKVVVAANTVMSHLLLGYSCENLGKTPFKPVDISLQKMPLGELLGKADSSLLAEAVILPGISAFVGADVVAGIYACDMDLQERPCMLLDIGTNGEMVIGDKNGFLVASAAAGPVFEGGNISCGLPAVTGAVSHIHYNGKGKWDFDVIGYSEDEWCKQQGEKKYAGFCGSGLVDLTAELWKNGMIDENGTFCDEYFESGFHVAGQTLTQADIRELQMGKAAIRAGIEILCEKKMPESMLLAGGFGTAMNVDSGVAIGLFPQSFAGLIKAVGNSALEGAHKFLLAQNGEERMGQIVQKSREIVLAKEEDFEEKYIHFMQFLV